VNWILISGVKPYDGRYEFDVEASEFTSREWGFIKRLSGYLPLTIEKGFEGGDPELFAVFAAIALRRAGRIVTKDVPDVFERIADAPFGTTIQFEADQADEEEADAGPPTSSSNGSEPSSGTGSRTSSETSPTTPPTSGTPDSAISESRPLPWVS
jgi:hypothetical protein